MGIAEIQKFNQIDKKLLTKTIIAKWVKLDGWIELEYAF